MNRTGLAHIRTSTTYARDMPAFARVHNFLPDTVSNSWSYVVRPNYERAVHHHSNKAGYSISLFISIRY